MFELFFILTTFFIDFCVFRLLQLLSKSSERKYEYCDENENVDVGFDDSSQSDSQNNNETDYAFDENLKDLKNNVTKCLEALGLGDNASSSEIKAAFKKKINGYHPDKVSGLGDRLKKVAEEESILLNVAYQTLKKKGFC